MAKKKKTAAAVTPKSASKRLQHKANARARDQFAALGLFIQKRPDDDEEGAATSRRLPQCSDSVALGGIGVFVSSGLRT
jgi:hypothetical protein